MGKAQISSQVFIYVLAAVIIGVVLIVGYRSISAVLKATGQAPIDTFVTDFSSNIERLSRSYGSVKRYEIDLPSKFDQICFIDSMGEDERFSITLPANANRYIKLKVEDNIQENVFLMNEGKIENLDPIYVESLDVAGDYLCLENTGDLAVWLEGIGKVTCLKEEQTDTCV